MDEQTNISVIICAHNPREDYLRRVLDALNAQSLPKDQWELLLIDNASDEPLANNWDLSWHPHARHIREDQVGLTPARIRGIRESVGELLVFVDDDNVLDTTYLSIVKDLAENMPNLGCFGSGSIVPEFEELPANTLAPYLPMLALREVSEPRWSNIPEDRWVPWGAGLCVKRVVAMQYLENALISKERLLLDRKGMSLNSCGDDEFSWTACDLGLGRGIFPQLHLTHLICKKRVQKDYLLRLAEGHAFSKALLNHIHGRPIDEPLPTASVYRVLRLLVSFRPIVAYREARRYWSDKALSTLNLEFRSARDNGTSRALAQFRDVSP